MKKTSVNLIAAVVLLSALASPAHTQSTSTTPQGKFGPNESWTDNPYYGQRGTYFADVSGNGKDDAIVVNNDRVTVRRSDGYKFLPNESWTDNPYYGQRGTYFADVNGDKKADAIVVNDDKVTVRRSNGYKFLPNESWTDNPYYG